MYKLFVHLFKPTKKIPKKYGKAFLIGLKKQLKKKEFEFLL